MEYGEFSLNFCEYLINFVVFNVTFTAALVKKTDLEFQDNYF